MKTRRTYLHGITMHNDHNFDPKSVLSQLDLQCSCGRRNVQFIKHFCDMDATNNLNLQHPPYFFVCQK